MRQRLFTWFLPLLAVLGADPVSAQWIPKFQRPRAEVGGRYDGTWQESLSSYNRSRAQQWVRVNLSGTLGQIASRPLVRLDVSARPYIGQGWAKPDPGTDLDNDGLMGRVSMVVAPLRYVSATARGEVVQSFEPDALGGYQQQDRTGWAVEVSDRNPLLPMTVSYDDRDESLLFFSGVAQRSLQVDRRVKTLRYQASNWKTRLLFHQRDVTSLADGRPEGYLQRDASASNTLRWGKGSVLRNGVSYNQRKRDREARSFSYGSTVHLQQTTRTSSDFEWNDQFRSQAGTDGRSTRFKTRVSHERGAVSPRVEVLRTTTEFGQFYRRDLRIAPQVAVNRTFSPRVALLGHIESGYRWRRQGGGPDTYLYVLEERQVFGPDGRIQLGNPFVDPASVTLLSPDGAIRYEEGFDYQVQESDPFWAAVALPGGRIDEGTEVVVDYRYLATPDVSSRTVDLRASLTLRVGGLSLTYRRRAQDDLDELPAGAAATLGDRDQQQLGLQYRVGGPRLEVVAFGSLERYRADRASLDRKVGTATVRSRLTRTLSASTRTRAIHSTGRTNPFLNYDAEFRLIWQPIPALRSQAFASYYHLDGAAGTERFLGFGSAVSLTVGQMQASLRLDTVRREVDTVRQEHRVSLNFRQAF